MAIMLRFALTVQKHAGKVYWLALRWTGDNSASSPSMTLNKHRPDQKINELTVHIVRIVYICTVQYRLRRLGVSWPPASLLGANKSSCSLGIFHSALITHWKTFSSPQLSSSTTLFRWWLLVLMRYAIKHPIIHHHRFFVQCFYFIVFERHHKLLVPAFVCIELD